MASLTKRKIGTWQVSYHNEDGSRKYLYLPDMTRRQAATVQNHAAAIVSSKISGLSLDPSTASWIANLGDDLRANLENLALVEKRRTRTLKAFLETYIGDRPTLKPATVAKFNSSKTRIVKHFGDIELRTITEGDADDWRNAMTLEGLAENTIRKHIKIAKQVFRYARRKKLIEENPFEDMAAADVTNTSRRFFVTREMAQAVLDACTDDEFRLIFALARFAGLRTPSETLALTWDDVDWERNLLHVHSVKTERYSGKESRVVPIFPELKEILDRVWAMAPEGVHIITRYRDSTQNLRTRLAKTVKRAGLQPWPKLFHNCRSTFQTEMPDHNPFDLVCSILGNSRPVAIRYYAQATTDRLMAMKSPTVQGIVQGTGVKRASTVVNRENDTREETGMNHAKTNIH
ncbi:MAG: tyrosine-type recombinase/integrase [Planctomycetaceae bacterium]|nr:tyrosine-type recombinase/integrase [Planctomycetaceae bacterium]